jgi:hypothetical protein
MAKVTGRKKAPYEPSEQRKRKRDPMARKPKTATTPMRKKKIKQKSGQKGKSYGI